MNNKEIFDFCFRLKDNNDFININDVQIGDYLGIDDCSYSNPKFSNFCNHIRTIKEKSILLLIESKYYNKSFDENRNYLLQNDCFFPIRVRNKGFREAQSNEDIRIELENLYTLSETRYSRWFTRFDFLKLRIIKLFKRID